MRETIHYFITIDAKLVEWMEDRIIELQSRLRWVITERDDTFVRMLRRAETAEAVLKKLEYWFDADQEVLDAMTPDERADNMRQLNLIREALNGEEPCYTYNQF